MDRQRYTRPYMWLVVTLGAAALLSAAWRLEGAGLDARFYLLALLTLTLGTRLNVAIPGLSSRITLSDSLLFLTLLLYGPPAAVLLAAAVGAGESLRVNKGRLLTLFNASAQTCSMFVTAASLRSLYGDLEFIHGGQYPKLVGVLLVMGLAQCVAGTVLVSVCEAFRTGRPILQTWYKFYLWSSLSFFVGAATAGVFAWVLDAYGLFGFILTALVVVSVFLTYRMYLKTAEVSLQQAEQSQRHVEELSRYIEGLRHAEAALKQSEKDYRGLFENAHDAIMIVAPEDETVLEVNQRACEMYGLGRAELVGSSLASLTKDVERGKDRIRELMGRGGSLRFESVHRRPDGTEMFLDVNVSVVDYKDRRAILAINRDVTERRALEEQLRQSQKMEAVGQLAGGIAHDFNNLMAAVTGYSSMLLADLGPGDPVREDLEEIKKAADRAASLTQQLLAFSRKQLLQPKVVNLNEVVADLGKMLGRLLGEDVRLAADLDPALWRVEVDPVQIGQVLINLALNARDAMPLGGDLTVATANLSAGGALARHLGLAPGDYVLLTVSDTGTGMDERTRARAFEPFYTTKEVGRGTGLGLSMVHGIVKQSGGEIELESAPGRGAHFRIYLPSAPFEEPAAPPDAPRPDARRAGAGAALLVEDDYMVRGMCRKILERLGFEVLEAARPEAAVEISARRAGDIQLMLTDVVMPGMSGRELAERLGPRRPGMRVLYMSGYTRDTVIRHGVPGEGVHFIQKPFTSEALALAVREVLEAAEVAPAVA